MDPQELLRRAKTVNPVELIRFVREGADNMNGIELYALVLALANKLEALLDREAASVRFDFAKKSELTEATARGQVP